VERLTIWYSLQANFVSLLVGFVAAFSLAFITSSIGRDDDLFTIWPFFAVGVSILVERTYLQRRLPSVRIAWCWTIAGNVVSAAACVGLLFVTESLRSMLRGYARELEPFNAALNWFAMIASALLVAAAFIRTRKKPE
jgi:hypothetical protein